MKEDSYYNDISHLKKPMMFLSRKMITEKGWKFFYWRSFLKTVFLMISTQWAIPKQGDHAPEPPVHCFKSPKWPNSTESGWDVLLEIFRQFKSELGFVFYFKKFIPNLIWPYLLKSNKTLIKLNQGSDLVRLMLIYKFQLFYAL
jgi:hypothetical protein